MLAWLSGLITGCDGGGVYARKDGQWMYGKEAVIAAGHEDIRQINDRFAKSRDRVWYRIWPIPSADPKSFQPLDDNYARDGMRAWYMATYRDSQDYFTSRRLRLVPLFQADPASLRVLEQRYAADSGQVYYEGLEIRGADPATFEPLTEGFARDKTRGYHQFVYPVPLSHGPTFEVVGKSYAKDREHVYFVSRRPDGAPHAERVLDADPATFQAFPYDYAKDASHIYFESQALKGEPGNFQPMDFGYAKTDKIVFHRGEPMLGADAASFQILEEVTDEATARDKAWFYKDGKAVKPAR